MADLDAIKAKLQAWLDSASQAESENSNIQTEIAKSNAQTFNAAFSKASEIGKAGPLQTIKALSGSQDPYALPHGAEALAGMGWDFAKHLAGQTNQFLQNISPVDLNKMPITKLLSGKNPFGTATGDIFPPPVSPDQGLYSTTRNIPLVSDIVAAPVDATVQAFHGAIKDLLPDATLAQKFKTGGVPALQAGAKAMPGVQNIVNLATGKDTDGNPLDAGSAVRNTTELGMAAGLYGGVLGRIAGGLDPVTALEGNTIPKDIREARSSGEIQAAKQIVDAKKAAAAAKLAERAKQVREQVTTPGTPAPPGVKYDLQPDGAIKSIQPVTAQTDLNAGTSAVPLDPRGEAVLQDLAPKVQGAKHPEATPEEPNPGLDVLYHSDTVRGAQSADILAGDVIRKQPLPGLNAPAMGQLEGQPSEIGNGIFNDLAQNAPDQKLSGQGPLSTEPGTSFNEWQGGMIGAMQGLRDEFTTRQLQGQEPRIGAVTHSKNLELAQAYTDAGNPIDGSFDLQSYINHSSGPPGAIYHYAPDTDGAWRMTPAEDTQQPGIYFIRHGETSFDGPSDGSTAPSIGQTPRPISYEDLDAAHDALPDAVKAQFQVERMLPSQMFRDATDQVFANPIAQQAAVDFMKGGDPIHMAIMKVMQNPEIATPIVQDLVDTHGASIEQVQQAFQAAYKNSSSYGGEVLGHLGNASQEWMHELDYTAQHGNLEQAASAMKILKSLREASETAAGRFGNGLSLGPWTKVAGLLQKAERLNIASMISPIRTAVGIAQSQFGLLGTDFMDAAFTSLANGFQKPRAGVGDAPAYSSTAASADLIGLTQSVVTRLGQIPGNLMRMSPDIDLTNQTLEGLPGIKRQLGEGLLFDTNEHMFGRSMGLLGKAASEAGGWRGLIDKPAPFLNKIGDALGHIADLEDISANQPGKALYNIVNGLVDFKLYPNRWQESFFRKLAFDARYRSNLMSAGIDYGDALQELNRANVLTDPVTGKQSVQEINPALREAAADATIHALRQTYAYTPEGGIFGGLLKVNRMINQNIFPTAIIPGITFPRAMVNNLLWQVHHSPLGIADFFTKDFQDAFNGLKDPLDSTASRNASRKIGEAMTGLMLFNMAAHMGNGGSIGMNVNGVDMSIKNGAKPWLWQLGNEKDEKGQPKVLDISSLQPFNNLWAMADHMMGWANGRPSTVTPEELASQFLNTNVGDVPMFAWDETLRNLGSKNPDEMQKALTDDFGRWIGGFGTVLKGMREEFAAIPPQFRSLAMLQGTNKLFNLDTKTGFVKHYQANAFPDALLAPMGSPQTVEKINIETGKQDVEAHPGLNLLKAERKPMSGFAELLASTPGYDINKLVKAYDDPHATQLVRQAYGTIINNPNFKIGSDQFQIFARNLASLHNAPLTDLFLSREGILPQLRQAAEQQAMLWDAAQDAKDRQVPLSQGRPVHFAKELADKVNLFKSQEVQRLVENFVMRGPTPGGPQGASGQPGQVAGQQ